MSYIQVATVPSEMMCGIGWLPYRVFALSCAATGPLFYYAATPPEYQAREYTADGALLAIGHDETVLEFR